MSTQWYFRLAYDSGSHTSLTQMAPEIPPPPDPLTDWIQILYWVADLLWKVAVMLAAALAFAQTLAGGGIV